MLNERALEQPVVNKVYAAVGLLACCVRAGHRLAFAAAAWGVLATEVLPAALQHVIFVREPTTTVVVVQRVGLRRIIGGTVASERPVIDQMVSFNRASRLRPQRVYLHTHAVQFFL